MKFLILMFLIIIGSVMGFLTAVQNGSFIRFLDAHPHPSIVPQVEYTMASTYYMLNDLQEAATYYQRVYQRFPKSTVAEDAYFGYGQSRDEANAGKEELIQIFSDYLEKYPNGKHADVVTQRIVNTKNRR